MTAEGCAAAILCAQLFPGDRLPLGSRQFSELLAGLKGEGMTLVGLCDGGAPDALPVTPELAERVKALILRRKEAERFISVCSEKGIDILSPADADYPARLKSSDGCPPILFIYGDRSLAGREFVGYVGTRDCDDDDLVFTRNIVAKTVARGYGVVSGGARGIDSAAEFACLECGGKVVEMTAGSLAERIAAPSVKRAAKAGNLAVMSAGSPFFNFTAGRAMERNRYIYMLASAAVVVRAHSGSGGTFSGASLCLKRGWCPVYCRSTQKPCGNGELISGGALPIDESWDGQISRKLSQRVRQIGLFDE